MQSHWRSIHVNSITKISFFTAMFISVIALGVAKTKTSEEQITTPNSERTLTVYSSRNEELIKPVFDLFTKETGVNINYYTGKAGPLLQKIKSEGKKTRADVLLTVDAGNLWHAKQEGVLAKLTSKKLEENIPSEYRDSDGFWYGLSLRARTIVYSPDRVKKGELKSYEDLASPSWKGRLCLRTSKKVYNQSLVAMLIELHGEKKAQAVVEGWVANLATDVFSNDSKVVKAVDAGQCDVGIVNTYYFGRLLKKNPNIRAKLFWPNQSANGGVHVNVSGGAVVAASKNKKLATEFLEFVSSDKAQQLFASLNMEYPVKQDVVSDAFVQGWGKFEKSSLNLDYAGSRQVQAIKLMDRSKYK